MVIITTSQQTIDRISIMQGSKSSFFSKSTQRARFDDSNWGFGGSNSKKHVDKNKQARRNAYRQQQQDNKQQQSWKNNLDHTFEMN